MSADNMEVEEWVVLTPCKWKATIQRRGQYKNPTVNGGKKTHDEIHRPRYVIDTSSTSLET